MRRQMWMRWGKMLALGAAVAITGGATRAQGQGSGATTVVRTLVYHEITAQTTPFSPNPILSASGNRAVFTVSPGTGDPAKPNQIFVVNADGSGLQQVDAYTTFCFCGSMIDISADGAKVVSSDSVQLRIANADGSGARPLMALDSNEIRFARITGDGSKVFFQTRRDANLRDKSPAVPVQRGVWVINADGSGLRQIVGPAQIAQLLGIPADNVFPFDTNGWSLDVSSDGSRIVFGVLAPPSPAAGQPRGERIFGVNLDGSGLHQILGPVDFVSHAGISADGSTVLYDIIPPPCCSTPNEAGVVKFDGTGRHPLANPSRSLPGGFVEGAERLQLSADGSKFLLGSTGVLFDTATGAALQLAARGGYYSSDPGFLADNGMYRATMNDSATRFLYIAGAAQGGGVGQLATLDLNPASLGAAPSVTNAAAAPAFILTKSRSSATVSAQVSATDPFLRVGGVVLFKGLADPDISQPVLLDDGRNGDARAGDNLFTYNALGTDCCAEIGPRTVRIKAEARAVDGKRHATAVDLEPLAVLDTAP